MFSNFYPHNFRVFEMEKVAYVGIDIGGSHISVGFVDSDGNVLSKSETHLDNFSVLPHDLVALITEHISENKPANFRLAAIGVGIPGQSKANVLVAASNLPNFKNVPLAAMISERNNNIPVLLLNDADAAICAEVWGKESRLYYESKSNIALITLGTGIGLGLILNNTLHQGSNGLVEGGHMIVSNKASSRKCGCGQIGCVEAYSSAKNTALRLHEMDDSESSSTDKKKKKNTAAEEEEAVEHVVMMGSKEVFERFTMNDFNAVKVVEEVRTQSRPLMRCWCLFPL